MLTYLKIHLLFTLPVVVVLYLILFPFISRKEQFKIIFLTVIAFLYTIPWDNYIVYHKAWSYDPNLILGVVGYVPIEEYAYFIIMTVMNSLWSIMCMRWSLPCLSFKQENKMKARLIQWIPIVSLICGFIWGLIKAIPETKSFYFGCICWWSFPVCAFLWYGTSNYCFNRIGSLIASIFIPTIYLSWIDCIAMHHHVWHIREITTYQLFVYDNLPFEEFFFFLIVGTIISLGCCAFDKSVGILDTYPHLFKMNENPNLIEIIQNLFLAFISNEYDLDQQPINDLITCKLILNKASKSFSTASIVFHSSIRQHISILYAFCRATDDMIDNSTTKQQQMKKLNLIKQFVNELFANRRQKKWIYDVALDRIDANYISKINWNNYETQLTNEQLSAFRSIHRISFYLPEQPFHELINGYQWDVIKNVIQHEQHLIEYSEYVASSVGTLILFVVYANLGFGYQRLHRHHLPLIQHARDMGKVLQIVNVSRDIVTDSESMARCYVPKDYLDEHEYRLLTLERDPWSVGQQRLKYLSTRMLKIANKLTASGIKGIRMMPKDVRGPVSAVCRVYIEIGNKIMATKEYKKRIYLKINQRLWITLKSLYNQ